MSAQTGYLDPPVRVTAAAMPESTPEHRRASLSPADASRDDRRLMARVARGDAAAFDDLVRMYWPATRSYAWGLAGDEDTAADITQEAFIRLWQVRNRWMTGSLRMWLFRTARNLSISEDRKRDVRVRWASNQGRVDHEPPRTPLEAAESEELRNTIAKAIEQLPPRRREALTLVHVHDMSYREVAEIMDISERTVASHLQAAIASLRVALRSYLPALHVGDAPATDDGDD